MADITGIEWCDSTFNPWIGCTKVSPGCEHCYAEVLMDTRWGRVRWGPQGTRVLSSDAYWRRPLTWNRQAQRTGERRLVFCASLSDWLEDWDELIPWRARLLLLIARTPNLEWLLLSKRVRSWEARMRELVRCIHDGADLLAFDWLNGKPPANVWMGTSVENQLYLEERLDPLLAIPARVRFLSAEPLLGPLALDLRKRRGLLDWVIAGGESGTQARPMHPSWVRSLHQQCQLAGAAFFMKQWGEYMPWDGSQSPSPSGHFPDGEPYVRIGKHNAGAMLDGKIHQEFPAGYRRSGPTHVHPLGEDEQ